MTGKYRILFFNSLLIYVSAFILTTVIHESGHFMVYRIFGFPAVLYHNHVSVSGQEMSLTVKVLAALAGPFISLLQGLVFSTIIFRKQKNSTGNLFSLWAALLGFINFFGYLMLTPFSRAGDTGKAAELLQLPLIYQFIISVTGIVIIILIAVKSGRSFSFFIPGGTDRSSKRKYIHALILYPVVAGSFVNVLLAFPVPVLLSVIYPATSSYVILSAYGTILKTENTFQTVSKVESLVSKRLILLTCSLIVLNRLLTLGIG